MEGDQLRDTTILEIMNLSVVTNEGRIHIFSFVIVGSGRPRLCPPTTIPAPDNALLVAPKQLIPHARKCISLILNMMPSQLDAPHTSTCTNTQPVPALRSQHTLRRKADIADLVLAAPAGAGAFAGDVTGVGAIAVNAREDGLVF